MVAGCHRHRDDSKPDVLILTLDAVRADHVPGFGENPASMPNLGKWIASGLRFTSAYTSAPITLPAHNSLFTGNYPWTHGVRTMAPVQTATPRQNLVLAAQTQGYQTGAFVSSVFLKPEHSRINGFDVFDTPRRRRMARGTVAAATAWLEGVPADRPAFLWVHVFDAHWPYRPTTPHFSDCPEDVRSHVQVGVAQMRRGFVVAKNPEPYWPTCLDELYRSSLAEMDEALGALRAAAAKRGQFAWVIVSDHGECIGDEPGLMGQHASTLAECAVRIPLAFGGLASVPAGTISSLASIVDVAPTLARALGWPMEPVDGTDLLVSRSDRHVRFESPAPPRPRGVARLLGGRVNDEKMVFDPDHHVLRAWKILQDRSEEISPTLLSGAGQDLARVVMTAPLPIDAAVEFPGTGRSSRGPAREGRGGGPPSEPPGVTELRSLGYIE